MKITRNYRLLLIGILMTVLMLFTASLGALPQEGPDFEGADSGRMRIDSPKEGLNSYIVVMEQLPLIAYEGNVAGFAATKPVSGNKIDTNSVQAQRYGDFLRSEHNNSLEAAGVRIDQKMNDYTVALNGYSALLTADQVKKIEAQPGVLLVLPDEMRYLETDSSPQFLGLTVPGGAYDSGFTGEGVVVGIIDSGIWPEHPSFADDGSYGAPPVPYPPCVFGNLAHNPNDAPFTCNNKLIGARQMLNTYRAVIGAAPDEFNSARDDNGHGTHTASTAAGNAGVAASIFGIPRGIISGIAPRAHVIAYKGLGNLGGFTSDLAAAIDRAVADGVDVINYSIGSGASGPGADEIAFLFAADAGVFAATSAGNSGSGAATVGNPGTMPWITTVGASTQDRFFEGTIVLGSGKKYDGASITHSLGSTPLVDAEFAGGDLCISGSLDPDMVTDKIVLCRRGVTGRAAKSLAVYQAGGVGMIMYENTNDNNLFSDSHWVPSVHVDYTPGLAIKNYIATDSNPTASLVTGNVDKWQKAPTMTIFSSRGPNPVSPDLIKPDITAPGIQILAGNSPFPDLNSTPSGELFQAIAGTSMSSPHVAGIFALIKQAQPDWSAAMAKSALMTTSYQKVLDNDRQSAADPFDMGAGHVDPGGDWNQNDSIVKPGLVYDAGLFEYAAYTCGMDFGVFTPGSCTFLEGLGIPQEPYNLNVPSIGVAEVPGSQTVVRTVTNVADKKVKYVATVKHPGGFNVTVTPAILELNPGDSATFEVTITNQTAPIGEWRFGSLTWKGGGYHVYSPIAVKAALFKAPAEISGSGASGSASLPVSFGYTGPYTAAPHGLVGATVTSDNVLQDPNQTFAISDVAAGGANLHTFNLSGAAFFRIAMPPEATEANADLDIFVYDPSDTLFASSTSGGTNELIDILLPADGAWDVYVHGWSAPGGDSDYDMWTWAVPLAPGGGSLSVDSAPASATIGTIGTVDISWSGLGTGTLADWYLGAVSHTDVGLLGLTLVTVDNR